MERHQKTREHQNRKKLYISFVMILWIGLILEWRIFTVIMSMQKKPVRVFRFINSERNILNG